jgi:ABC-type transport system substrate-binding protein
MDRRAFLKSASGAVALATNGVATPGISQRAGARTLRLVPHADLANFDPIWTPAYIARNGGVLVWDTLYGVDNKLQPQRQMIESEEVSSDGLIWTFRLRPGLKFHDGEPVLAKDAVASAGTPPNIPSWGNIMAEGRALWQVKPYIVFFPAIFLSITVLAVNLLGDGLRDALDPRLAKRM